MRYGKIKILIQKRKIKIAKYKNYPNPTKSIFQIACAGNVERLSGWNNQLLKLESMVLIFPTSHLSLAPE